MGNKIFLGGVCLSLSLTVLNALELTMNSGKEAGQNFSVLRLSHTDPFYCQESYDRFSEVNKVTCIFDGELERGFSFDQTFFFKIDAFQDQDKGVVVISPKKKMRLFALNQDSKQSIPIVEERAPLSLNWQIVGYEEQIPFLKTNQPVGLNFPIAMKSGSMPYIGALDVAKRPLVIEETPDTQLYISVKGFMERKSYHEAINGINELLLKYPKTLFKKDLLLFKIAAMFHLNNPNDTEDMVALAKSWLKAYPTDVGVSQVLYILAKTYGHQRFYDESRYYYDRLKEEYPNDKYELLSRISFADDLQTRGDSKKAPQLYISALNDTKDTEVASLAAYSLADYYILRGTPDDRIYAKRLLDQVIEVNPNFFIEDPDAMFDEITKWAEQGFFDPTAKIAELLYAKVNDMGKKEFAETLLRSVALWYESAGDFKNASQAYKNYLNTYPAGEMHKEMARKSDNLLFSYNEGNVTKRLENLDRLIQTYPGSEEAKKAYAQKAQLLLDEKRYKEAIALENILGANDPVIMQAVAGEVQHDLANGDCTQASFYLQKYHQLNLTEEELLAGFDCLVNKSFFDDALRIADQAHPLIKTTLSRLEWLYRIAKTQEKKGDYPKAIFAARDGLYMSDSLGNGSYNDIIFILVNSLLKEGRVDEAMQYMPRLEESFKDDNRMIEVEKELLSAAAKRDDRPAIEMYAKELMRLQELHKRPEYSPWVELTYVQALIKDNRLKDALAIINKAEQLPLSNQDLAQVLYNKGAVADSLKLTPLSLDSYKKCSELEGNTPYKQLCLSAYNLLKDRTQNDPLAPTQ